MQGVALLFRFHNSKTGDCFPSLQQLAEATAKSKHAAVRANEALQEFGYATIKKTSGGRNRRNEYTFETVSPAHPLEPSETVTPAHPEGDPSAPLTVSPAHPHITLELNTGRNTGRESADALSADELFKLEEQTATKTKAQTDRFDEFWSAYPKKVSKDGAKRVYAQIVKKGTATEDELIAGAERYAAARKANGTESTFIKHPTTWLRNGCWADEAEPAVPPKTWRKDAASGRVWLKPEGDEFAAWLALYKSWRDPKQWDMVAAERSGTEFLADRRWPPRS